MRKNYCLIILTICLSVLSCEDTGPGNMAGCCDKDALYASVGNGSIFVPNLFTPNGDSVDDWFYPRGDSIANILEFEIHDYKGEVVFRKENAEPGNPDHGWNGNVNGKLLQGLYSFSLTVEAFDGNKGTFSGEVCNYPCVIIKDLEIENPFGCYSGIYYDCQQMYIDCNELELTNCQF